MKVFFTVNIPLKIESEANLREHWTKKAKRGKIQKFFVENAMKGKRWPMPCAVVMKRYGKKRIDDDNLVSGFKKIRDVIADCMIPGLSAGKADGDERIEWHYQQEIAKEYSFDITIVIAS